MQTAIPRSATTARKQHANGSAHTPGPHGTSNEPSPATRDTASSLARLVAQGERDLGLSCPGTVEGILTAVGILYLARASHASLSLHVADACQPRLGETVLDVVEDEPFAWRVFAGFERACSSVDAKHVIYACQSDDLARARAVAKFMRAGFELHAPLTRHIANPDVAHLLAIAQAVSCECERARQFVRFHKTPNDVYFARFEPKANVVPLVMGHFASRFNTQTFIIHDPLHRIAGLWDGRHVQYLQGAVLAEEDRASLQDDRYYQALWKRFYDSLAIEARTNHELRRQLMPKRFWKNLPEMSPLVDPLSPKARHHQLSPQTDGRPHTGDVGAPGNRAFMHGDGS